MLCLQYMYYVNVSIVPINWLYWSVGNVNAYGSQHYSTQTIYPGGKGGGHSVLHIFSCFFLPLPITSLMSLGLAVGPAVDPASDPGTVIVQGTPPGPAMMGHSTVMVRGTQSSYHYHMSLYNQMWHKSILYLVQSGPDMTGHETGPDMMTDPMVMPPVSRPGPDMTEHSMVISTASTMTGMVS